MLCCPEGHLRECILNKTLTMFTITKYIYEYSYKTKYNIVTNYTSQ